MTGFLEHYDSLVRTINNLDARIRKIDNREVRVQEWQTPSLLNSWANVGAPYADTGYYKDPHGLVHLRGALDTGSPPSVAFVLPTNYRPQATLSFSVPDGATVEVESDGSVNIQAAVGAVSLDAISFRAEN